MLPGSLGQIGGYPPDAIGKSLHDTGPAQGFQTTHMAFDQRLGIVPFVSLRPGQCEVMVGAVKSICRQ
ncbi:hypothetical protein D3C76_1648670 [compost metagenome]